LLDCRERIGGDDAELETRLEEAADFVQCDLARAYEEATAAGEF
jgi:hypothetical protein